MHHSAALFNHRGGSGGGLPLHEQQQQQSSASLIAQWSQHLILMPFFQRPKNFIFFKCIPGAQQYAGSSKQLTETIQVYPGGLHGQETENFFFLLLVQESITHLIISHSSPVIIMQTISPGMSTFVHLIFSLPLPAALCETSLTDAHAHSCT